MPARQKNEAKMRLSKPVLRSVITCLLTSENHREIITGVVSARFLDVAMNFLRRVAIAKMENKKIDHDWYKANFLAADLDKDEIANNAGTHTKTIQNAKQTTRKEVVIAASLTHYRDSLCMISELLESLSGDSDININLKIKINKVEVELELTETLIVVNALAAKRISMKSGAWSTVGKRVEKPLMETLCRLFGVAAKYYRAVGKGKPQGEDFDRETDFYLCPPNAKEAKCEVKLVGNGNPESADAVIAHKSDVYVADKMSDTNKKQLNSLGVLWVELHSDKRFVQFQKVLKKLHIPYDKAALDNITDESIKREIHLAL